MTIDTSDMDTLLKVADSSDYRLQERELEAFYARRHRETNNSVRAVKGQRPRR